MDNDNKYGITDIPSVEGAVNCEEKYWGNMSTIFDRLGVTVKRIFMRAGTQSSMEYHIHKQESYYIEQGKLDVGLRIGRGKNKFVTLEQGQVFHIQPGLMHMRMAVEDTVIIELSTTDDDSDSHIVEDGKTYTFVADID